MDTQSKATTEEELANAAAAEFRKGAYLIKKDDWYRCGYLAGFREGKRLSEEKRQIQLTAAVEERHAESTKLASAQAEIEELRNVEIGLAHANHELEAEDYLLRELVKVAREALEFYAQGNHQYREEWPWILADVERLPTVVNVIACLASGASPIAEASKIKLRSGRIAREALAKLGEPGSGGRDGGEK